MAVNMIDIVRKNGDKINISQLSKELGCEVCEISALKGVGVKEAAERAVRPRKAENVLCLSIASAGASSMPSLI